MGLKSVNRRSKVENGVQEFLALVSQVGLIAALQQSTHLHPTIIAIALERLSKPS